MESGALPRTCFMPQALFCLLVLSLVRKVGAVDPFNISPRFEPYPPLSVSTEHPLPSLMFLEISDNYVN